MQKGKVSIIIPHWNGKEMVKQTLEAIKQNTLYKNYEVIVIDNNSTDGSVPLLQGLKENGLVQKLVLNKENMGFAYGNNQGFALSDAEYCFMLSNDTIPQKGWLKAAVQLAESDARIASVGLQTPTPAGLKAGKCKPKAIARERQTVCGAAMLMRKEVIDLIGPLDAKNFSPVYGEESDWNFRAGNAGFKVMESMQGIVVHIGSPSAKKRGGNKWQYILMNTHRLKAMLYNLSLWNLLRFVPGLSLIFLKSILELRLHWLLESYWNNLRDLLSIIKERRKRRHLALKARKAWLKSHAKNAVS